MPFIHASHSDMCLSIIPEFIDLHGPREISPLWGSSFGWRCLHCTVMLKTRQGWRHCNALMPWGIVPLHTQDALALKPRFSLPLRRGFIALAC